MGSGLQRLATRWKHAVGWTSNSTQLEWRQQEGAIFKEYQSCASASKDIETVVFRTAYGAWQRMLEHMNFMCFFGQTMGVYRHVTHLCHRATEYSGSCFHKSVFLLPFLLSRSDSRVVA